MALGKGMTTDSRHSIGIVIPTIGGISSLSAPPRARFLAFGCGMTWPLAKKYPLRYQSLLISLQVGLLRLINSTFFSRRQVLISFSLAIATCTLFVLS